MSKTGLVALALGLMMFMSFTGQCHGALQFGFYREKCIGANVEENCGRCHRGVDQEGPLHRRCSPPHAFP